METFGFSEAEWTAAKSEAKQLLSNRAKLRGMISYSDLVLPTERGPPEPAPDWPPGGVIPLTYHPVPDIA